MMQQQQQQYPGMMQAHQAAMMIQQHQYINMQLNNNQLQQRQARPTMVNHHSSTNNPTSGGGGLFPPHPMFQNPQMFMAGGIGPSYHGFLPQAPFFPPPFAPPPPSQQNKGEDATMMEERTESSNSTTTPTLQPPAHLYNGPPVSALVPRAPRGLQPSPPSIDAHHRGRSSFGSVVALPTPPQATTTPAAGDTKAFHFATTNDDDHDVSPPPAPPMMDNSTVSATETTPSAILHRTEGKNVVTSTTPPSSERSPLASLADNNPPPGSCATSVNKPPKSADLQEASLLLGLRQRSPTLIQVQASPRLQQPSPPPKPVATKTEEEPPAPPAATNTETPIVQDNEKEEPTSQDPLQPNEEGMTVPKTYPKRLALPEDHLKLNSLHCFLRQNLLEIFVVEPNNTKVKFRHAPSSSVGRVGFRCVFCAAARRNNPTENFDSEAPMAIFYPKATAEIYRLVTSWQRCHLRKCKQLPPPLRAQWELLKHDKTRGKTQYWVVSAHAIGLRDRKTKAGGIHFELNDDEDVCCQPVA